MGNPFKKLRRAIHHAKHKVRHAATGAVGGIAEEIAHRDAKSHNVPAATSSQPIEGPPEDSGANQEAREPTDEDVARFLEGGGDTST